MHRGIGVLVSSLFVAVAAGVPAAAAPAEYGDEIETFAVNYRVSADGVLHVTESIDYKFAGTGRHGIYRDLVIREPYADDRSKDQKYVVSNISVSSPDAPDQFTTSTTKANGDRDQALRIKIGSKDRTIWGDEATYLISYDVRGALRHFADHSELYWDATGSQWDAEMAKTTVRVQVPEGVQKVACYSGLPGSTRECDSASVNGGVGQFSTEDLASGNQLTIVAGIKPGVVQNDTPIVVGPPNWLERNSLSWLAVAGAAVATLLGIGGAVLYRRLGVRDQRYAGLPPGALPPDGATAPIAKDTLSDAQLPVAFAPPAVPVGEATLMIDPAANDSVVAATMIDLAVRGAVRLENPEAGARKAVLVDQEVASTAYEKTLLKGLFPTMEAGSERLLQRPEAGDNKVAESAARTVLELWQQVGARGWYLKLPAASGYGDGTVVVGVFATIVLCLIAVVLARLGGVVTGARVFMLLVAGSALLVPVWMWVHGVRRGRRSAAGRAIADQVLGFRMYLTTAEADQLRFEEGEDIFSRYLPWAIAFGTANRWQRVCAELVEAGRLTPDPVWYVGTRPYYYSNWLASSMSQSVQTTFSQPPAPASAAGSGGGSSSGFSSYSGSSSSSSGSAGGGGGGGGGGSW
ncbi:MAG TPA: DUF2207 domain-containing protein [Kribbella sp.]